MTRDELVYAIIDAYIVIADFSTPGIYNKEVVLAAKDGFSHAAMDLQREFTELVGYD